MIFPRMVIAECGGLLRLSREQLALPAINVKRVYRVMRDHRLLLARRVNSLVLPASMKVASLLLLATLDGVPMSLNFAATTASS